MASNKKAQILAAVMCASSIFGSYTMVSAETSISNSKDDVSASVATSTTTETINGEKFDTGRITATANNGNSQTSTITLQGNSLGVNVGYNSSNRSYEGTFTLNSKNLKIDSSNGLRIYDGINTSPTATISKAGAITGTGLTVNGANTSTISSINSRNSAQYAKSEVNYSTGVKDTVANGTNTTTSTVAYNGVTDTVTNDTSKVKGYTTTAQVLYSGVNNKVVDNNTNNILAQTSVGLVDRPQDNSKYGNIVLTANKYVVDTEAAVTKKVSTTILTLDGNTAKLEAGTGGSNNAYVLLNSNKTGNVDIKAGTVDGVQGNVTLSGKNVNLSNNTFSLKNTTTGKDIAKIDSYGLNVNGTSTSTIKTINSENATIAQSQVSTSGIANTTYGKSISDTVYNADGIQAAKSNVGTTSIEDTVYDTDGRTALSKLTLSTTNAELKSGSASVKADNTTGNVTLSGKNVNLGNNTFSLKNTTTGKDIAKIDSSGLNVNGTSTSSIKSTNSTTDAYVKNEITSGAMTTTARGGKWPSESDNKNKTISQVSATGVRDNVYDDSGNIKSTSVVDTNGVTLTSNRYDTGSKISSSLTIKGDSATLASGSASVTLNNTTGNVAITANQKGSQGYVTLSGKNASLTSAGLTVNGTNTINAISEVSKTDNSTGSTITTTTTNKTTSSVVGTGVTDTVTKINNGGVKDRTTSSVTATAVTDNVYDNILTDKPLATSNITKGNVKDSSDRYGSITLTANKYGDIYDDEGIATSNKQLGSTSLSLSNNVAKISSTGYNYDNDGKLSTSTVASMTLDGNTGNVTLSGKNVNLTSTGLTLNKIATTENGTPIKDINGNIKYTPYASLTTGGLTINGTSTSSIKSTGTKERYTKNDITSTGMTTTAQGDGVTYPGSNDNVNKTTSTVAYNGVTDTVYDANGKRTSYSNVGTTSITDTVYDTDGNTILASSSISKSGKTGKIALTTNKYDEDGNKTTSYLTLDGENVLFSGKNASLTSTGLTVNGTSSTNADAKSTSTVAYNGVTDTVTNGTNTTTSTVNATGVTDTVKKGDITVASSSVSTSGITNKAYDAEGKNYSALTLTGNSASLKVNNKYGFGVDSSNNVSITGNNATLSGNKLTLTDVTTGKTATLDTNGLSLKDANGTQIGGVSAAGAVSGTSLSIKAPIDPIKPNNDYVESKVTTSGVADTVKQGGFTRATSNVTINSIKDTIYTNDGKELSSSNISKSVSDATESGSVTLIANKITTNDDATTTTLTSKLNLTGDSATLTSGSAYVKADNTTGNVLFSGKNVSLSGSTFTLKDVTNGKTLASLGDRGLSLNKVNSDGTTINYGTWNSNGLTLKDTNGKTATLTTSGLTLKDEDGNTTGGISTTGAVTGTSLNITAKNDAGNKTISKVDATSVTDTVYGTDGTTQVASSSVGINGISNNTNISGIAIKDDVNNTKRMTTSIAQDKNGVNISSTKYNVYNDGTSKVQTIDGISTISVNGAKTTISGSGYKYEKDENGKPILDEKGNPIRSSYTNASLSVDGESGIIGLSGKNVGLSANGLTLYKDVEGVKTQYASLTAGGLNVNGTGYTTIKSTNATTGAMGQSQLSYNGVTDTVTNAAGNKTTSTINSTSVTDTVYDTDGTTRVASSSVGTSGISNTTTALQMTGTNAGNTMSTGIYQNNGGISATATKKDVDGNTIGTSTLSLGGNSASLKVGNYGFAVDSNNNVSITGDNATLSGSTFTLKDVNTGKTAILNTNGLTLKDGDGTITGGISTTGAVTGTSLRITTSEDAGGNKTVSTVATNAVTDTVTNTKTNNKTTSQVSATGVRDTVYDANNKTVASSTVTTSGISNNTNISGIAIKDDEYNTKTMSTSIAQNANGVNISSTKYNVYNDGTNTVQTTDGISSISVNGAKTTISGYGYKYEKDENGKPILDEKGNPIRSSYTNASLSVDGESGIIGLSGKNVGLSANGLTLYKDVEGVKTQYASLTAGGLNVNGTGYTTIKSTNATTGAMGQSQLSYNGVTDTVTNAAGNKTTSTVNATGTIDQVYDTDGKTRIAYSNITTTGITDSFTKDGITNSVTTNANGTTFASTGNGSTIIKGGAITTNSITVAGNTIDGGFFDNIGKTNGNTAGIVRTEINGDWITSIEGALDISRSGNISLNADKLTYSYNDGKNSGTLGALANKVDDIYDRTQGIDYDKATGTTTIDGNLSVKDETTTGSTGSTGETGTATNNGNITANTANIGGVQIGKNAVTATTGNFDNVAVGGTEGTSISKDGVTVGDKKSDNYTSITNNDVVVNNNGSKTSLTDVGNRVTGLESSVSSMNNRLSDVEDRIDKVGAMSAAIANLRTMGFDPEAPTEIAIGVGQYKSETGLALGVFHYPNQDFMLSASISTSGDEVMGGIGATWKLGRKSAAEKAKDEEARRLEKAEEMKKLAQDAKVKAQAERHAKLLAEREAQKTA